MSESEIMSLKFRWEFFSRTECRQAVGKLQTSFLFLMEGCERLKAECDYYAF